MASERPFVIGFLSQAWTLYCLPQLAGVVEYVASNPSLTLRDMRYMTNPQTPEQLERGVPPWTGLVDGIVTSEGVERDPKETADWMLRGGVPVVNLGADLIDPRIPIVHTQSESIGELAAEHFLSSGIRHFAAIGFIRAQASQLRRDAFAAALSRRGHTTLAYDLRVHIEGLGDDLAAVRHEKGLVRLLQTAPKPVGILAVNDSVAVAVCQLAMDQGLLVPEDVAVLGVGNSELSWTHSPSISSIRTPGEAIGFAAAQRLHQILKGKKVQAHAIQIPAIEVIARQSTLGRAPRDAELDRAIEFIHRHAGTGISVEQVMQTITMSRRLFEQLYMDKVGRSPGKEIQRLRHERAEHLLRHTELPIGRIAQMLGFSESAAFSKCFKKQGKLTPSQFRSKLK